MIGQLNQLSRRLRFLIAGLLVCACLVTVAMMYQSSTVSYEIMVLNQVTGPIVSPTTPGTTCSTANTACPITNFNLGAHELSYCIVGGTVSTLAIELEASNDNVNWFQISNQATGPTGTQGCGNLEAGGYYTYLRANVLALTGTAPKITAWYSGMATAIPGGGLIAGNKTSQPVTFLPDQTFTNTNLKSSSATIGPGGTMVIDSVTAGNPNASFSYVQIASLTSNGGFTTGVYAIPANQTITIPIARGIQAGLSTTPTVACSTLAAGQADPGTGCVVTIHYRPYVTVNTQVNNSGTPVNSGPLNPN